jgi:hypothetical protein
MNSVLSFSSPGPSPAWTWIDHRCAGESRISESEKMHFLLGESSASTKIWSAGSSVHTAWAGNAPKHPGSRRRHTSWMRSGHRKWRWKKCAWRWSVWYQHRTLLLCLIEIHTWHMFVLDIINEAIFLSLPLTDISSTSDSYRPVSSETRAR